MSESQHTTISDDNARPVNVRRLMLYLCLGVLVLVGTVGGFRAWAVHGQRQIHSLGGKALVGLPEIYYTLKSHRRTPRVIRQFLESDTGRRVFNYFPAIYGVDLRGIRDETAIEAALQVAKDSGNVRELVLYQSAVTDKHLELLREGFSRLQSLKINETAITDRGIAQLRHLPELRLLNAQRTLITNVSVPDLIAIPRLKELSIAETKITSGDEIRKARGWPCVVNDKMVTLKHTTDHYRSSHN